MSENTPQAPYASNLANDIYHSSEPTQAEDRNKIEADLMQLMNHERCPEGLKKALWRQISELRRTQE